MGGYHCCHYSCRELYDLVAHHSSVLLALSPSQGILWKLLVLMRVSEPLHSHRHERQLQGIHQLVNQESLLARHPVQAFPSLQL